MFENLCIVISIYTISSSSSTVVATYNKITILIMGGDLMGGQYLIFSFDFIHKIRITLQTLGLLTQFCNIIKSQSELILSTFDPKRTKYERNSGIILCLKPGVPITKYSILEVFFIRY